MANRNSEFYNMKEDEDDLIEEHEILLKNMRKIMREIMRFKAIENIIRSYSSFLKEI